MRRYVNIPKTKSPSGKQIYQTVRYPSIPRSVSDIYVYVVDGDRFDTLAQQYYEDSSLWWIISLANDNLPQNSLSPPPGAQIRIPSNISSILADYKSINEPSTKSGTPSSGY